MCHIERIKIDVWLNLDHILIREYNLYHIVLFKIGFFA